MAGRLDRRSSGTSWLSASVLASAFMGPCIAAAADGDDGRPWGRGIVMTRFGFGVGYHPDVLSLDFGLGARFFVANGLALGLSLDDSVLLYSSQLRAEFPLIQKQLPTNDLRITPNVQWVFFRWLRFSPYVMAGVGPAFINHGGGTLGHWVAGPGAYIGITPRVFIQVGVSFSGLFPGRGCRKAFTDRESAHGVAVEYSVEDIFCGFTWTPSIGLVIPFGPVGARPPTPRSLPARPPAIEAEPEPAPPEPAADLEDDDPYLDPITLPDEDLDPIEAPTSDPSPEREASPSPASPEP